MVATALQQLSLRPFAVSLRAPSAAQGRRASFVVRSQKSQNEAQAAAQQAIRYSYSHKRRYAIVMPLACAKGAAEHHITSSSAWGLIQIHAMSLCSCSIMLAQCQIICEAVAVCAGQGRGQRKHL